jgi:hypothetical protein
MNTSYIIIGLSVIFLILMIVCALQQPTKEGFRSTRGGGRRISGGGRSGRSPTAGRSAGRSAARSLGRGKARGSSLDRGRNVIVNNKNININKTGRRERNRDYYNDRPYGYWRNFIYSENPYAYSSYYPYGYWANTYGYNPYDYTNTLFPPSNMCYSSIGIEDAFGPYTAGVMGKQAWLDFAGRNGFETVALDKSSYTNDHAILGYVGQCTPQQQVPPPSNYAIYPASQYYY